MFPKFMFAADIVVLNSTNTYTVCMMFYYYDLCRALMLNNDHSANILTISKSSRYIHFHTYRINQAQTVNRVYSQSSSYSKMFILVGTYM